MGYLEYEPKMFANEQDVYIREIEIGNSEQYAHQIAFRMFHLI